MRATPMRVDMTEGYSEGGHDAHTLLVREIDDPNNNGKQAAVARVKRGGADDLWARGRLTMRQKATADRFDELCSAALSDGLRAIDYGKQRVDVTHGQMAPSERKKRAQDEIARIERQLGRPAVCSLRLFIFEGCTFRSVARKLAGRKGGNESYQACKLSKQLTAALDALDTFWNAARAGARGIRSTGHEAGEVQVEFEAVDKFEGMSAEELAAHAYNVGEALKRMAKSKRQKAEPVVANDNKLSKEVA